MRLVHYTGSEAILHPIIGEIRPGFNEIYDDAVAAALISAGQTSGEFLAGQELTVTDESLPQAAPLEDEAGATDTPAESDGAPAPRARKRAQE